MKLLFFSDFHFERVPSSAGIEINYKQPVVFDPSLELLRYLKERYSNQKVSFVVFLGDYANGSDSDEGKLAAFNRIKYFAENIEKNYSDIFDNDEDLKNRIIFIDGNHDVSRIGPHHDMFEATFGDYLTPFAKKSVTGPRKNGAPLFDFEELDLQIACISTTENAGAHFANSNNEEIISLLAPLKAYSKKNYKKILQLMKCQQNVDIGSVTAKTKENFTKYASTSRKIGIVCSHHPLIQMQHESASHFETVNGPGFFDTARAKGFRFFVSGHLHEFYCADIFSRGRDSDLPSATIISIPSFLRPGSSEQCFVDLEINNENYICKLLTVDRIRDRIEEKDFATNGHLENAYHHNEHTLLDYEIQELIQKNRIIRNASTDHIQAASYDCALGLSYKRYDSVNECWPEEASIMDLSENDVGPAKITLNSGERVLLYTNEEFEIPKDMFLQASPRASWIRRGISVDLSFFVEPGFVGTICFPVTNQNNHPIIISAQEAIMSIVFHKLSGPVKRGWSEREQESKNCRNKKHDR